MPTTRKRAQISRTIRKMKKHGKPQKQAVAIALRKVGVARKRGRR